RRLGLLLTLEPTQRPQFIADYRMGAWRSLLDPADVQGGRPEVHLIPPQVHQLRNPETMPVSRENHCGVPVAVAVARGGLHEPLDLGLSQVFAGPQVAVAAPSWCICSFLAIGVTSLRCDFAMSFNLPRRDLSVH